MDRTHTVIKGNKATYQPGNLVFVDCETRREKPHPEARHHNHVLRLGCWIAGRWRGGRLIRRKEGVFTKAEVFWQSIESRLRPKEVIWIFAHRAGFDMTVLNLWERLDGGQYMLTKPRKPKRRQDEEEVNEEVNAGMMVIEDPPTIIMLEHVSGGRINIVDTMNYYRMPLAAVGDAFDKPKLPMPDMSAPDEEWWPYCKRDVEILEESVCNWLRWVKRHDLGNFAYTLPSQAYNAYRHRFMPVKLLPTLNEDEKAIARAGYFGGQTEAFYVGNIKSPCYLLDVKSLFPHVMAENLFPAKAIDSHLEDDGSEQVPPYPLSSLIAEVDVATDDFAYPYRREDRLLYANGNFTTTLVGPELQAAAVRGHVQRVRRWVAYRMLPIFKQYVEYFTDLKQKADDLGDRVQYDLAKLMLNSLYGKFGQMSGGLKMHPERYPPIDWGRWDELKLGEGEREKWQAIAGYAFRYEDRSEKRDGMPEIAAFVCSYAREHMRRLRRIAGRRSVFYMAVDSLLVDAFGYQSLLAAGEVDSRTVGKLRLEHQGDTAKVEGLGWYRIGDRRVEMGLKADARPIGKDQWQESKFSSLKVILAEHPLEGVREHLMARKACSSYSKGVICPDKWVRAHYVEDVLPLRFKNCSGKSINC